MPKVKSHSSICTQKKIYTNIWSLFLDDGKYIVIIILELSPQFLLNLPWRFYNCTLLSTALVHRWRLKIGFVQMSSALKWPWAGKAIQTLSISWDGKEPIYFHVKNISVHYWIKQCTCSEIMYSTIHKVSTLAVDKALILVHHYTTIAFPKWELIATHGFQITVSLDNG